jgi:hypothetical protein
MHNQIKVLDLTTAERNGDSVAMVHFEALKGTVHVYRDGTVVLSSPAGTTVVSLPQPNEQLWRRTQFLRILARLGTTEHELAATDRMISEQEKILSQQSFPVAVETVSQESVAHFQNWCQRHNLDYDTLTETDIDQLVEKAVTQVRTT